mgnify:FL=1
MKEMIKKSYGRQGEDIVRMNYAAVDRGGDVIKVEIPAEWANIQIEVEKDERPLPEFIKKVVEPMNAQKGDDLPVSVFLDREDGTFPAGTTKYEKRGIAVTVPEWIPENCIQCNQCAYICPHAAIRPFLLTAEEAASAPEGTTTLKAVGKGMGEMKYRLQVSVLDCTGCGNCVEECPSKNKALIMKPLDNQHSEISRWEFMDTKIGYKEQYFDKTKNVKNSQFAQPLFEFSGACSGCGETPYIKLITQLYGERMIIANATGCSSIYGGSAPSTPYTSNYDSGHGVAWANSLFEDNAEYGFGIATGIQKLRNRIAMRMKEAMEKDISPELKEAYGLWIEGMNDYDKSNEATKLMIPLLEKADDEISKEILALHQYLIKKSIWVIGGDGWAYDIGYGGLDHVMACLLYTSPSPRDRTRSRMPSSA